MPTIGAIKTIGRAMPAAVPSKATTNVAVCLRNHFVKRQPRLDQGSAGGARSNRARQTPQYFALRVPAHVRCHFRRHSSWTYFWVPSHLQGAMSFPSSAPEKQMRHWSPSSGWAAVAAVWLRVVGRRRRSSWRFIVSRASSL